MSMTAEFGSVAGLAVIRPTAKAEPTTTETEIAAKSNSQSFLRFPTS